MPDPRAGRLRELTGYPWMDCIEALQRADGFDMAREMLPVIYRERRGIEYRGETTV